VSFGDHVPYLRVLAPRKDVQGTVYLWAEGASLTCCEFEQHHMSLIIYRVPVLYFIMIRLVLKATLDDVRKHC
jgi:hypothetical protein